MVRGLVGFFVEGFGFEVFSCFSDVLIDEVVSQDGGCGCLHGGVASVMATSSGSWGLFWGLASPFIDRLTPAMLMYWWRTDSVVACDGLRVLAVAKVESRRVTKTYR